MSVYIKGLEMPKNCGECKFFAWKQGVGNHCAIDDSITFHAILNGLDVHYEKNGNCPLVPVPTPHGDLIERDALLGIRDEEKQAYEALRMAKGNLFAEETSIEYLRGRCDGLIHASGLVRFAPTIIEAEEK